MANFRLLLLFPLAIGASGLFGCSSDDKGTPNNGTPNDPGDSALAAKLAACPVVDTSSDAAATACLEGTFSGKTLAGDACTLTVKAAGAYDFTAPTLSFSFTPKDNAIRVFTHSDVSGSQQVVWLISDPVALGTTYDLNFTGRFGQYTQDSDKKINIEVTKRVDTATTSVNCVVPL